MLERDAEGRVIEAFTPDFYLPDQDLYLEVTVMKQSLVTRKNRKLRKLRAQYPTSRSSCSTSATSSASRPDTGCGRHPERPGREHASDADAARRRGLPRQSTRSAAASRDRRVDRHGTTPAASRSWSARSSRASRSSATSRARRRSCTRSTSSRSPATARATRGSASSRISTRRSTDRDVLLVDAVIDTGLTMHYLVRSLALRSPARCTSRRSSTARTAGSSTTCRCATSASRSRTSSSSATASSSTSATATCRICGSSAQPPRSGRRSAQEF